MRMLLFATLVLAACTDPPVHVSHRVLFQELLFNAPEDRFHLAGFDSSTGVFTQATALSYEQTARYRTSITWDGVAHSVFPIAELSSGRLLAYERLPGTKVAYRSLVVRRDSGQVLLEQPTFDRVIERDGELLFTSEGRLKRLTAAGMRDEQTPARGLARGSRGVWVLRGGVAELQDSADNARLEMAGLVLDLAPLPGDYFFASARRNEYASGRSYVIRERDGKADPAKALTFGQSIALLVTGP